MGKEVVSLIASGKISWLSGGHKFDFIHTCFYNILLSVVLWELNKWGCAMSPNMAIVNFSMVSRLGFPREALRI